MQKFVERKGGAISAMLPDGREELIWDSNPPKQCHASYEVSALPPSHHGWVVVMTYNNYFLGISNSVKIPPVNNVSTGLLKTDIGPIKSNLNC